MNIEIRKSCIDDLDEVFELIVDLLGGKEIQKLEFDKLFEENLKDDNIFYLVCCNRDKVVGFISLYVQKVLRHAGRVGEIQELIVSSEYRGTGIGKKLFNYVKNICKAEGCVSLEVSCRKIRTNSLAFYESVGMICSHNKLCLSLD